METVFDIEVIDKATDETTYQVTVGLPSLNSTLNNLSKVYDIVDYHIEVFEHEVNTINESE